LNFKGAKIIYLNDARVMINNNTADESSTFNANNYYYVEEITLRCLATSNDHNSFL